MMTQVRQNEAVTATTPIKESKSLADKNSDEIQANGKNPDNIPNKIPAVKIDNSAQILEESQEMSHEDFEAKLAEAETKGYLRGRNERIAELMREPAIFERQSSPVSSSGHEDRQGESQPLILNNQRVSIWDR